MKTYVLGFLFSEDLQKVVLIRKNRPEWQAGRYNGLGGSVLPGETSEDAMDREFFEEAGLHVKWTHYAMLEPSLFHIDVYWARGKIDQVATMTDEAVRSFEVFRVVTGTAEEDMIGNVPWLVQMALAVIYQIDKTKLFYIREVA